MHSHFLGIVVFIRCLLFIVFLTGCSSSPEPAIVKHQLPRFDFDAVTSYSTFPRDSKFAEFQDINDALRNTIELAIEREFDRQGFVFKEPDEADVMVAYQLSGLRVNKKKRNADVHICPEGQVCDKGQKKKGKRKRQARNFEPGLGSLVINLINTENKQSIWKTSYPLDVEAKDNSRDIQEKIEIAIIEIMKQYPTFKQVT